MIILKGVFRKRAGGMGWIELAHDRDRCWTLVNVIMNLRLP
jgi:hypothetical protein